MSDASLVVLAAGRGTRFGGPKQLVAVRPDGATITDIAIERAARVGIGRVVVVVSDSTAAAMGGHLAARGNAIDVVSQGGTRGTAQALLAARHVTEGPVVVVNADDIYPQVAFGVAAEHLAGGPSVGHAVIGFALGNTLYGTRPQSRALLDVHEGHLTAIREGRVTIESDLVFAPKPTGDADAEVESETLRGDELVSMNAMVLQRDIFDRLEAALDATSADEVYLPDVVGGLVADGVPVRVLRSDGECHGLTYADDVSTLDSLL